MPTVDNNPNIGFCQYLNEGDAAKVVSDVWLEPVGLTGVWGFPNSRPDAAVYGQTLPRLASRADAVLTLLFSRRTGSSPINTHIMFLLCLIKGFFHLKMKNHFKMIPMRLTRMGENKFLIFNKPVCQ